MSTTRILAAAAALLALAACDNPAGRGGDARVDLRFGVAGAARSSQARMQASGTDQLVITGTNGTLTITDLRLVVAEFKLKGDDDVNTCSETGGGDDCEDFEAGPLFVDLPLSQGAVSIAAGDVPAGVYEEIEFEVEDLDDDEEDAGERARIQALRQTILAQFPDWPREASLLVVGTFTPTGGQPVAFRRFVEAEIEIEIELNPALTVGEGGGGSVDVLLDPAVVFKNGARVINLAQAGSELEIEVKIESGFRGESDDDDEDDD